MEKRIREKRCAGEENGKRREMQGRRTTGKRREVGVKVG